jgi:hypothetical protein
LENFASPSSEKHRKRRKNANMTIVCKPESREKSGVHKLSIAENANTTVLPSRANKRVSLLVKRRQYEIHTTRPGLSTCKNLRVRVAKNAIRCSLFNPAWFATPTVCRLLTEYAVEAGARAQAA